MKKMNVLLAALLLTACSSGGKNTVAPVDAVNAAYATVEASNQVATMDMDMATIVSYFGLDESMIEDAFGKGPMMSAHIDMIVAIQAKAGNVEQVEDAVEAFQDNLEQDTMQYPTNLAAIQNAEVFSEGNNVYYVRLNTYASDLSEDQMAEEIEKINDKAENAIDALHK